MLPRAIRLAALLSLGAALAGCGDRACIQWSEAEGACPSRSEAIAFMVRDQCNSSYVVSVDGDPEVEGNLCCYDVTKNDNGGEVICAGEARPAAEDGP